jgi:predicted MFS family arabinose efflux permease
MVGNLISWTGDWMDLAALNWAVLTLTGSAFDLGLINACRLIPVFALSLPAGVLADRYERRRLLIALQAGTMILTFLLGVLVLVPCSFACFAAVVSLRASLAAMVLPIRNALLPAMVDRGAMPSAIATHTAGMNLARIIGPAIAGAVLFIAPIEALFGINGLSFLAVLWTLVVVKRGSSVPATDRPRAGLLEAVSFIRADGGIRSLLILAVVPMTFGFPYTTLLPLFSRELLHLGPAGFTALLSISAAGALAGSTWLALRRPRGAGRSLILSILGLGLVLVLLSFARSFLLAAVCLFLVGLSSQVYRTMSRITLQDRVPDHLRGRILSIALLDRGFIPLGAVLLGGVADLAGAAWAGLVMGGGCIMVTLGVLLYRREIWRL